MSREVVPMFKQINDIKTESDLPQGFSKCRALTVSGTMEIREYYWRVGDLVAAYWIQEPLDRKYSAYETTRRHLYVDLSREKGYRTVNNKEEFKRILKEKSSTQKGFYNE
jgi:hypothetical protein